MKYTQVGHNWSFRVILLCTISPLENGGGELRIKMHPPGSHPRPTDSESLAVESDYLHLDSFSRWVLGSQVSEPLFDGL